MSEQVKQAVADIDWLREHGQQCEWYEAQDFGDRHLREHIQFGFEDTYTNRGANASVDARHLRIDRSDRINRLVELDKIEEGREVLRAAFRIANMKGAAYDL